MQTLNWKISGRAFLLAQEAMAAEDAAWPLGKPLPPILTFDSLLCQSPEAFLDPRFINLKSMGKDRRHRAPCHPLIKK